MKRFLQGRWVKPPRNQLTTKFSRARDYMTLSFSKSKPMLEYRVRSLCVSREAWSLGVCNGQVLRNGILWSKHEDLSHESITLNHDINS